VGISGATIFGRVWVRVLAGGGVLPSGGGGVCEMLRVGWAVSLNTHPISICKESVPVGRNVCEEMCREVLMRQQCMP
jgi:hypothetical protein